VVYVDDAAHTTQIGQMVAAAAREVSTAIQ
jgi:hypothetical protein